MYSERHPTDTEGCQNACCCSCVLELKLKGPTRCQDQLFKRRKLCRNDEVQYSICCNDNLSQVEKWLFVGWHALQQPQACADKVTPWPYEPQLLQGRMGLEDTVRRTPHLLNCQTLCDMLSQAQHMLNFTPLIVPRIIMSCAGDDSKPACEYHITLQATLQRLTSM